LILLLLIIWYNIIILRLLLQRLLIGYGKKINKVLFPWPDTAYLSGPRIPITVVTYLKRRGETHAHARVLISVRSPRFRPSEYMRRRRHRCRSPEGHLPRGKNAFSSRPWLSLFLSPSLFLFFLYHSLSLQLSAHDIIQQ